MREFKLKSVVLGLLFFSVLLHGAGLREVFSNSAVHLAYSIGPESSTGSGFILFRPMDGPKGADGSVSGWAFLITNKHVLPPEGKECKLSMRVTSGTLSSPTTKTIELPIVGADGKYLKTVRLHAKNDVAVVAVTDEVVSAKMKLEFVFTTQLGTKAKLGDVALVGDEVYILGYPAGIYDTRNANPVWRVGIVSTSPLLGYAFPEAMQKMWHLPSFVDGFLIDAQIYPGSSGSMVVNVPTSASFDAPGTVFAGGPRAVPYVLGILSDSIPIADSNLRLVTRMGLGIVQSADAINDTIEAFFEKK